LPHLAEEAALAGCTTQGDRILNNTFLVYKRGHAACKACYFTVRRLKSQVQLRGAGKLGQDRFSRSRQVEGETMRTHLPPCNHACPAGENIQAWLAHAGR
jgi:hypothetical protein